MKWPIHTMAHLWLLAGIGGEDQSARLSNLTLYYQALRTADMQGIA